jgi:predicted PhzF superfamily epimerase YddE/YHI9
MRRSVREEQGVLGNVQILRDLAPDMAALAGIGSPGVIATAPGDGTYDFISRYFPPAKGIPEDPVIGAAHCILVYSVVEALKVVDQSFP